MTYTDEPVKCPYCRASLYATEDVLTLRSLTLKSMILVACATCRNVLGVLPPITES